jgi:penicillin-binding protein 1C
MRGWFLAVAFFVTAALWYAVSKTAVVPSFETVRAQYKPSDVWALDHRGYPMESVRMQNTQRSLDWVRWSEISVSFQETLVRVEDQRFFSHNGVDVWAVGKALMDRLKGRSYRGASTLTMQLVNLLHQNPRREKKGFAQKIRQAVGALKLELSWKKEHILEAYVNLVPFRGELVGVHAASMGYFSKKPSGLEEQEASLLVALLRAPNASSEVVAKRVCAVLQKKTCEETGFFVKQVLSQPYRVTRSRQLVPVLSKDFLKGPEEGSFLKTTLDVHVQRQALTLLREQLHVLKKSNVNGGAVLVLETHTGRVVAYVANTGAGVSSYAHMNGVRMRRQAGSTLKPFVYATAFDKGVLQPSSLLQDVETDIVVSYGFVYHPRNYEPVFRGWVGVGDALGSSMNVPAVRALQLVGVQPVLERMQASGFETLKNESHYGLSLALGTADVSLWELTQGYRQFAHAPSVFSSSTQKAIFDILASPEHRRFTFGLNSVLNLPFAAAVKTGTSKDMRDNWCIGWTPDYTVGVWVGNFNGEPMWDVSGVSGAAPVWRGLMLFLHPHPSFSKPLYTPPSPPLAKRSFSKITYPVEGMFVGIDPDIPQLLQKLPIEIENIQKNQRVFLDGTPLHPVSETILWPVQKGKHLVELKNGSNQLMDAVAFEVR